MNISRVFRDAVKRPLLWIGLAALPLLVAQPASALQLSDIDVPSLLQGWSLNGRFYQTLSLNLQNVPELQSGAGQLSMNRSSAFFELNGPTGPLLWTIRTRFVHEFITPYEKKLERMTQDIPGNGVNFNREYDTADIREMFFTWTPNHDFMLRVGRQQVSWGQTDFFHANDVVESYDYRWRTFLVPEGDRVRKPQIMLNSVIKIPSTTGSVQLLFVPTKLNDPNWFGNSEPTFGGRWSNNLSKGLNLMAQGQGGIAPFNHYAPDANSDSPHYGLRWKDSFNVLDQNYTYSLDYFHGQAGFQQDPILVRVNQSAAPGASPVEFILPTTDTFGGTMSGFVPLVNAVFRLEASYNPARPLANGAGTIVKRNAYNFMAGLDFSPQFQNILHTSSASLLSFQVFDWYIPGIDFADQLVRFNGSGYYRQHNVVATVVFSNPFLEENLNFTLVGLVGLSDGGPSHSGGMIIPSISYDWGPHWTFKAETDVELGGTTTKTSFPPESSTLFGSLRNNDQLFMRVGYQF